MKKSWRKLGVLYAPAERDRHPKLRTHASNPLPVLLGGNVYRIFFSARDEARRSSVGAVDVDVVKREIVREHYDPLFQHGPDGSFFADGVSVANVYALGGKRYMLFMGWQNPPGGHWRGDIGRLILREDLSLEISEKRPFMGISAEDPISLSYPWATQLPNGSYRMWYGSTVSWDAGNGEMLHVIKYADSQDGHSWTPKGIAVPYLMGVAQAFSRPTVTVSADGRYEMWYSYRGAIGTKYRIGYAVSEDGEQWLPAYENSGIGVSAEGWDSDMIEYPFVFEHLGESYMLYNGNQYGRTGFGLAVRDE